MKPLPLASDLLEVATRVVWFEPPEVALAKPARFLAYVMSYGTPDDVATVKRHVGEEGFAAALDQAPPGIIDNRSWAYWNVMAGRYPVPPMPKRTFE